MTELKNFLNEEVEKRMICKLEELKSYAETDNKDLLYLVEDIMLLLGIKAIWHKISNLVSDQEKFNRTVFVNGSSRSRTLITKKGVCKIIASMRTKPHDLICEHFGYQSLNDDVPIKVRDEWLQANSFEPGPNNIYIKRLQNIFSMQQVIIFLKVEIAPNQIVIIDVFFPRYGIVLLFNKKSNIFDSDNTVPYLAAEQKLLKKYVYLKSMTWIQFTAYDTNNTSKFDELLKDLIMHMIK